MAVCKYCDQEMTLGNGCTVEEFHFEDGWIPRIRFGDERPRWSGQQCGDCGVPRGALHHPGCDIESCPRCRQQALSCDCIDMEEERTDESDWVEINHAIEIVSNLIGEDLSVDHLFIERVAASGRVAHGWVHEIQRGDQLPLDEWFRWANWMGDETAAALFICRSQDFKRIGELDLDVAREMTEYTKENCVIPWEMVFVTKNGNFRASDLLGLPGHPEFDVCNFDAEDEGSSNR